MFITAMARKPVSGMMAVCFMHHRIKCHFFRVRVPMMKPVPIKIFSICHWLMALAAAASGDVIMNASEFVARYAGIYEHSPWVAEETAADAAASTDIAEIATLMAECVDNASAERQLALIRAHPDLAGKAQIAGELTADSTDEQASAGLD